MRVAFLDPLEGRTRDFPAQYLPVPEYEVLVSPERGQFPDGWEAAEAVVWSDAPLDRDLIGRMPKLRFLQRIGWFRARGDATAALERGIPVSAMPYGTSDRVAQSAFTLVHMLIRQIVHSMEAMKEGQNPDGVAERNANTAGVAFNWVRTPNVDSLVNKTVGILGFGEIGSCLARLLSPYACTVLAHRRRPFTPQQERHYGVTHCGSLHEVLQRSDVVVSFVPYSQESHHLLGEREFGLMKPTAYFVNEGRGGTVDDEALVRALREGRIAGAGLDVFTLEPLPMEHPFRELAAANPNLILTPHAAGGPLGWHDTFGRLRENLRRVQSEEPVVLPLRLGDYQPG